MRYLVASIVLAACSINLDHSGQQADAGACSTTAVSFQHDVVPIIGHCGGQLCHGASGTSWPYTSLYNQSSTECAGRMLVKPGDPSGSYLMNKLEGVDMCSGTAMPRGGAPLTSAQLATLSNWICQGAHNN
jgi:hypothetical protein